MISKVDREALEKEFELMWTAGANDTRALCQKWFHAGWMAREVPLTAEAESPRKSFDDECEVRAV